LEFERDENIPEGPGEGEEKSEGDEDEDGSEEVKGGGGEECEECMEGYDSRDGDCEVGEASGYDRDVDSEELSTATKWRWHCYLLYLHFL